MIDTGASTDEVISLEEYLRYLEAHLDITSEESLIATAPKLLALSRNRTFLATFLDEGLSAPWQFQNGNPYIGPTFVLGAGEGYLLRVVGWQPRNEVESTPAGDELSVYADRQQFGHNHNFSFLTTCYWGDGYETDLYECEPGQVDGRVGERVKLRYRGRKTLPSDRVMLYRAHRDVHVQYPTGDFSISLNLITQDPEKDFYDQYVFTVPDGEIIQVIGSGNDSRIRLLELATALRDPAFEPYLRSIADGHPSRRVREKATAALVRLDPPGSISSNGSSAN